MNTQPNPTLYVRNLDEKLNDRRMKTILYTSFSRYGRILEIHYSRRRSMCGQAWIVFQNTEQAIEAKKRMTGKELYQYVSCLFFVYILA